MNSKDFNKLVEDRITKIGNTIASKGAEYSTDDNKLHNFDKAAIKRNTTREIALQGMLTKHEVSVDDIILKTSQGIYPSIEVINEKLGDIINYYILLEACLVDRQNQEEQRKYISKNDINTRKYPLSKEETILTNKIDSFLVKGQKYLLANSSDGAAYTLDNFNGSDTWIQLVSPNGVVLEMTGQELKEKYKLWKKEDN